MPTIPKTHGDHGYDGVHDQVWPPPQSETAERIRLLTLRLNVAAEWDYVWTPSLINKFVLCLKADRRAREILAELVGSKL